MVNNIGSKIKTIRTRNGDSQSDLANKLNFHKSYLSRIENNKVTPNIDTLIHISDIYDVKLTYFFDDDEGLVDLLKVKTLYMDGKPLSEEQMSKAIEIIKIMLKDTQ
jgi:transcriptional regulator with XRE-family HTH domain